MKQNGVLSRPQSSVLQDPEVAQTLWASTRFAYVWLPLRMWLGWQWIQAGWARLQDPSWMDGGAAFKSILERAVAADSGQVVPYDGVYDWYRGFLELLLNTHAYSWFAQVVAYGETLAGIALFLGLFTGIAAFTGSLISFNFTLVGTLSVNPLMFALAVFLVLAWKTAGWIGLDRWLLPLLMGPRTRGRTHQRHEPVTDGRISGTQVSP